MSKEAFINVNFSQDKLAIIETANRLIEEYQEKGLRLTLRQLYYQFIAKDLFPDSWMDEAYNLAKGLDPRTKNTVKNYKRLGGILNDGRLAGEVDWDGIEDRVRVPKLQNEFRNLESLIDAAFRSYRLPRWDGQKNYVELWVEKDALAGVLEPMASEFHVTLMVNRGYSSQSAMYAAAQRFNSHEEKGQQSILFYLGDHDPSGEDMVRDIRDRLTLFGNSVRVEKLALTMAQIRQYNPPPNPTKRSDSRAKKYSERHGDESWEVDALPPEVMHAVIREAFEGVVDTAKMDVIIKQEDTDKSLLREAVKSLRENGNGNGSGATKRKKRK